MPEENNTEQPTPNEDSPSGNQFAADLSLLVNRASQIVGGLQMLATISLDIDTALDNAINTTITTARDDVLSAITEKKDEEIQNIETAGEKQIGLIGGEKKNAIVATRKERDSALVTIIREKNKALKDIQNAKPQKGGADSDNMTRTPEVPG